MPKSSIGHQERLRAVENLLLWAGQVSRARLAELFEVHGTVLSRDMAAHVESVPDNCRYDLTARAYIVTPYARPHLTEGKFEEYEGLVGSLPAKGLRAGVQLVSIQQNGTDVKRWSFSRIHIAIREGKQIDIEYRSLSNPVKHPRTIRPHAFIQAGPRWHVRAYCGMAEGFRDFNLGRIARVEDPVATEMPGPESDREWNRVIELRLRPHPHLNREQEQLVRDECLAGTVMRVFEVRLPLSKFVIQARGAAIDVDTQAPPEYLLAVYEPEALPHGALL
ncbi:WYL domain-containing protein [Pseudomarimonas arenosa]|uniref:WYL domain-containing protein n=1 Tax=Pseudomarimonas arenosa TaxID=2774145 RepID=A0AAW3ZGK7_9GAMM|nr:WYL domain-containing protein [Pseudomarimonas arenosa]MBD8524424.1 WYL domain-containing protein [Pseudomarimonas arenosa]